MKKILLGIFIGVPALFFAQKSNNNAVSNMQNLEWGTESHVIPCKTFSISEPLRDLMQDASEVKSHKIRKEYPDKRDMPVQTFKFNPEEDGKLYGNDKSIIQSEFGTNQASQNKALEQNWAGQSPSVGFRPFDPSAAAGPNHIIQAINGDTYRIWNKTGTVMASGNISALFPSGNGDGDPIVLYDKAADRWFMSQFAGSSGNGIYIAISATADPLGAWYTYEFSSPDFPDYLKFSAWQDGYYMTANYAQKIFAFNRDKMLAGDGTAEAVFQTFNPPQSGFWVPLPADASDGVMPGAGKPCPIFAYQDNAWGGVTNDAVNIWNATVDWTGTPNLTVTAAATLNTALFDASYDGGWNDITQPGTTTKLDGIGGCLMFRAQWKTWGGYNTVVLNWAVQVSASQRGIFWCELRQNQTTDAWSIYQQGIYAPGTDNYWMGSIAMNNSGDIGLSYAKAGASTFMSLGYTGRLASDPLNTMPISETIAVAGTSAQTGINRVGDYAQTTLDPDGETFWYTGEYLAGGAKTRVYSYKFTPACVPPTNQANTYSSSAIGDNQMTINWVRGNGNAVVVIAHEGAVVDANPATGIAYTGNSVFGSGEQIGAGNFVVYEGTGTSVTVTGLTPGTDYHYSVFEYTSATNCYLTPALTDVSTTTGVAPCVICGDVTSATDDATGFTEVTFNTISNTSTGDPAYTDYTAISTTVNTGQSYDLGVQVNTAGNYVVQAKAWIDWNQNCDFTDAGEEYDLGTASNIASGPTTLSPVSIAIPGGASLGNTVIRLRTTWEDTGAPLPCGNQNYSETEDYTLEIVSPSAPPVASFTPSITTICEGGSISFTDGSVGADSWAWDFGDGNTSIMQNPTHTFGTGGAYTVTLTVTNAFGTDVSTTSVTINSNTASTQNLSICQGESVTVGSSTYSAGGTFTDVIANTNGCDSTITTNLTVNPLPSVSITTPSTTECADDPAITLVGSPSGGTFSGTGVSAGMFNPAAASIGINTVTYSYTDGNGCSETALVDIEVINCIPPVAAMTAPSIICEGNSVVFTDASSDATGWTWDFGDATPTDGTQNPTHVFTTAGNYTVTLTVTSAFGTDMTTTPVTVGAPTTGTQTVTICQGETVNVGTSAYTSAGTFTDLFTNSVGCDSTLSTTVIVNPLPTVSVDAIDPMCVYNPSITLIGTPAGGTFSGNGVSGATFDPAAAGTGTHTITYSYTDGSTTCTGTTNISIVVDGCAGIEEEEELNGVSLYPIPNDGHFAITGLEEGTEYKIYDEKGRLIFTDVIGTNPTVELPKVETGIYYLQAKKDGKEGRIKFLIAK